MEVGTKHCGKIVLTSGVKMSVINAKDAKWLHVLKVDQNQGWEENKVDLEEIWI